jgi:hypothetical protein
MPNNATSLPPSVTIALAGESAWTWNGGTTETRALQAPTGANRVAATEYCGGSFTFDVTFTDGVAHQLALYLLDRDNLGRVQSVDVLDPIERFSSRCSTGQAGHAHEENQATKTTKATKQNQFTKKRCRAFRGQSSFVDSSLACERRDDR